MSQLTYAPELASRRSFRGVLRADPLWARPSLACLLAATTVLYVWGLGASGWANSFYSAAVQAGAHSWKAFFFGSSDAANFITVDKTPMAVWPMELTARVFGVNAWSILLPQALMGVAAVAVLYATVRRSLAPWGPNAAAAGALLAGAALATTPVAVLMFRFNNPDALLVLLLTAGAYALLRAREHASTTWLLVAAACVGSGFLTKMLQAFLVVPVFALVYAVTAPVRLRRRLWQLTLAALALIVSAGWWVAIVAAIPAGSRPYAGGSQHDSVLELALGYNGFGRLNGDETGGLGNTNQDAGWKRMFGPELAGQIAWLLPAAFILLAAGVYLTTRRTSYAGRGPDPDGRGIRTDPNLAGLALWGGWLLVTDAVFSLMRGIFHGYYTVALAPAVAALVGMGGTVLWLRRHRPAAAVTRAVVVAVTGWWAYRILGRTPDFAPWLHLPVLVISLIAATAVATARWLPRRVAAGGALLAIVTCLAAPSAYAVETASTAHHGAIPSAGPTAAFGGPGFGGPGFGGPGSRGGTRSGPGRPPGAGGGFRPGGIPRPLGGGGGGMGGPGAVLDAARPSTAVTALLKRNAHSYVWVAATVGSNNAAGYQLAGGEPVMAIGGFNGTDPAPSLAEFQQDVRVGRIHYFIGGSMGRGSGPAQQITAWVAQNFTARTVGGTTIYDLSG